MAQNKALPDIVHGLNQSVASRAAALYRRAGGTGPCMMTGGVARNQGGGGGHPGEAGAAPVHPPGCPAVRGPGGRAVCPGDVTTTGGPGGR